MKKIFTIILYLCLVGIFAQENNGGAAKEAGIYQRKSVSFLNAIANDYYELDESWKNALVAEIQDSVRMDRFDYNKIRKKSLEKFSEMPAFMSVEEKMQETIVPSILRRLNRKKESRAQALLTEQQKNSFITDKAKESGVTQKELDEVMNLSYIFAPVFLGYTDTIYNVKSIAVDDDGNKYVKYTKKYEMTLTAGGYWWKIDYKNGTSKLRNIARIERAATVSVSIQDNPNYQYAAFKNAVRIIAKDVMTATKNIPDFQLSAQILNRNPRTVTLSIGSSEGIRTDDKFWVYESIEDEKGAVTQKRRGWVMIRKVAEQSKAQIISGKPYIGSTVREIPRFPIDITVGFVGVPFSLDKKGTDKFNEEMAKLDADNVNPAEVTNLKNKYMLDIHDFNISNAYGAKLNVNFNLLSKAGFSQWWLGLGGEYFIGDASGDIIYNKIPYEITSSMGFSIEMSFMKKIYFRRFALSPQIVLGVRNIMIFTDYEEYSPLKDVYISKWGVGGTGNLGAEFAITPKVNLGSAFGYRFYGKSGSSWNLSYSEEGDVFDEETGETKKQSNWKSGTVSSGDLLVASGFTFSVFVSFTIRNSSGKYYNLSGN